MQSIETVTGGVAQEPTAEEARASRNLMGNESRKQDLPWVWRNKRPLAPVGQHTSKLHRELNRSPLTRVSPTKSKVLAIQRLVWATNMD